MPELPEVESSRRILERALVGRKLVEVEVAEDDIVLRGSPSQALRERLADATVARVGRKGKFWWIDLDGRGSLIGHLGMSGAIVDLTPGDVRMVNYQNVKVDPMAERPRFLKLWLGTEEGRKVAMVDGRRLGRLWWNLDPHTDPQVAALGRDAYTDLPEPSELERMFGRRKAPIKALLLNQAILSGIGNYLADEILYRSRIAPGRLGNSIGVDEFRALHDAIQDVVSLAVDVDADYERFPKDWLFHVRWGGGRGDEFHLGEPLVRETIGGRTTAWVPSVQK